jgi:hypothetical protein
VGREKRIPMNRPEIQMLWVSGELSALEQLSIASFLRNGHPVRLFSYQPIPNLPQGTLQEDARAILAESEVFTNPAADGNGGLTVFANFFRYHLLLQRGGIWSDCDVVCARPISFADDMEYMFATERLQVLPGAKTEAQVTNCFFKAPPGSPVISTALEIARSKDLATAPWGSTGPHALHQAATELGLAGYMLAPDVICPIDWWRIPDLVSGIYVLPANAYAIHFWNERWRRNFFDKNGSYDPLCLYERLKAHYLASKDGQHG